LGDNPSRFCGTSRKRLLSGFAIMQFPFVSELAIVAAVIIACIIMWKKAWSVSSFASDVRGPVIVPFIPTLQPHALSESTQFPLFSQRTPLPLKATVVRDLKDPVEVVIVGAGCAGSTLAITLARQGRRVMVIERSEEIPVRSRCARTALNIFYSIF
jgi:FAD binding domain